MEMKFALSSLFEARGANYVHISIDLQKYREKCRLVRRIL